MRARQIVRVEMVEPRRPSVNRLNEAWDKCHSRSIPRLVTVPRNIPRQNLLRACVKPPDVRRRFGAHCYAVVQGKAASQQGAAEHRTSTVLGASGRQ